jgi:hypothetical protein
VGLVLELVACVYARGCLKEKGEMEGNWATCKTTGWMKISVFWDSSARSYETPVDVYQTTRCHIPEEVMFIVANVRTSNLTLGGMLVILLLFFIIPFSENIAFVFI